MMKLYIKTTKISFIELKEDEKIEDFVKKEGEFFISMEFFDVLSGKCTRMLYVMGEAMSSNLGPTYMREIVCQILGR